MSDATPGAATGVDRDAPASAERDVTPVVRIMSGSPTDAELAAVHAVIAATLAEQANAGVPLLEPHADGWHQSTRQMRAPLTPGPGSWNASRGARGCR